MFVKATDCNGLLRKLRTRMCQTSPNSNDLSTIHEPVGSLLAESTSVELDAEQLQSFQRDGYVAGVPILSEDQISQLRGELSEFFCIRMSRLSQIRFCFMLWVPGDYEQDFMTFCGILRSPVQPVSCSVGQCVFGMISCFASRPSMVASWLGIRTIRTGRVLNPWHT